MNIYNETIVITEREFQFAQSFATDEKKHLMIKVIATNHTYQVQLIENNYLLQSSSSMRITQDIFYPKKKTVWKKVWQIMESMGYHYVYIIGLAYCIKKGVDLIIKWIS